MNRLRELRQRRFTQDEVAKYLNVSRPTYGKYESGEIPLSEDALRKLSKLYMVSTDYILGITDVLVPDPEQAQSETDHALSSEIRMLSEDEKRDILAFMRYRRTLNKDTVHKA